MQDKTVTSDLADFGFIELKQLEKLIRAYRQDGLPSDFNNDEFVPMFNKNSGFVFLTNSDFQVAMMNGDKLESFYSCPECGHEGFKEEMAHDEGKGCREYLREIKLI